MRWQVDLSAESVLILSDMLVQLFVFESVPPLVLVESVEHALHSRLRFWKVPRGPCCILVVYNDDFLSDERSCSRIATSRFFALPLPKSTKWCCKFMAGRMGVLAESVQLVLACGGPVSTGDGLASSLCRSHKRLGEGRVGL